MKKVMDVLAALCVALALCSVVACDDPSATTVAASSSDTANVEDARLPTNDELVGIFPDLSSPDNTADGQTDDDMNGATDAPPDVEPIDTKPVDTKPTDATIPHNQVCSKIEPLDGEWFAVDLGLPMLASCEAMIDTCGLTVDGKDAAPFGGTFYGIELPIRDKVENYVFEINLEDGFLVMRVFIDNTLASEAYFER